MFSRNICFLPIISIRLSQYRDEETSEKQFPELNFATTEGKAQYLSELVKNLYGTNSGLVFCLET